MKEKKDIEIYLSCMEEIKGRLFWIDFILKDNKIDKRVIAESIILQLRKTLELIAFAAIIPNKNEYKEYRLAADEPKDFRKDYNGRKIIEMLKKINPYFYPRPSQLVLKNNGIKHLELFPGDYLTTGKYSLIYDKCGKFLHADNPWDDKKFYDEFISQMPKYLVLIHNLLSLHCIIIMYKETTTAWIIELGDINNSSKVITSFANGPVFIDKNYYGKV